MTYMRPESLDQALEIRKREIVQVLAGGTDIYPASAAAITASGMESFENALLGIPMVVMYKMNLATYLFAKLLVKIPYVGMPNVLANKKLVPEFIQGDAQPKVISDALLNWIRNPNEKFEIRKELINLRQKFGENGASERAARAILEKVALASCGEKLH